MDNEIKETILTALRSQKGDDLIRAQLAFSRFTTKQMQEEHGQSGKTRREILIGYQLHENRVNRAIEYVTNIN